MIVIDVKINKLEDISNKFNDNKLADELSKYIYDECKGSSLKENVKLRINSSIYLSKEDKNKIMDMIRSNYGLDVKEDMLYIKYADIKGIILFALGILLICISRFLDRLNYIWIPEILLIISWGLVWEAVYNFVFLEAKKRLKIKRLRKLTECKIEFIMGDVNESN